MSDLFERRTHARAAVLDLADRGLLRATGADRVRFLNGMLTNDVATLAPGRACAALLLTRKGHVLSELQVLSLEGALMLDVAPGTAAAVREILEKHIIADDVRVEDVGAHLAQLAIEGPGAREALEAAGIAVPAPTHLHVEPDGAIWIGGGALTPDGVRLVAARDRLARLRGELDLPALSPQQVALLRIDHLVPEYGIDVSERNFPQEARLDAALSYTKGCYIGQEIIARIHSRGAVRRFLAQLELDAPVPGDAEVHAGGHRAGELTRAARPEGESGCVALAYLGREWTQPGTEVEVNGVRGRVTGPL